MRTQGPHHTLQIAYPVRPRLGWPRAISARAWQNTLVVVVAGWGPSQASGRQLEALTVLHFRAITTIKQKKNTVFRSFALFVVGANRNRSIKILYTKHKDIDSRRLPHWLPPLSNGVSRT